MNSISVIASSRKLPGCAHCACRGDASPEDPDATVVSWEANQARAAAAVEEGEGH